MTTTKGIDMQKPVQLNIIMSNAVQSGHMDK